MKAFLQVWYCYAWSHFAKVWVKIIHWICYVEGCSLLLFQKEHYLFFVFVTLAFAQLKTAEKWIFKIQTWTLTQLSPCHASCQHTSLRCSSNLWTALSIKSLPLHCAIQSWSIQPGWAGPQSHFPPCSEPRAGEPSSGMHICVKTGGGGSEMRHNRLWSVTMEINNSCWRKWV